MTDKPTQVEDHVAESRIKWSNIVQSLILASILGAVSLGYAFGSHLLDESEDFKNGVIDGLDGISNTLKEMRKDISELSTGFQVNKARLDSHDARISRLEGNQ